MFAHFVPMSIRVRDTIDLNTFIPLRKDSPWIEHVLSASWTTGLRDSLRVSRIAVSRGRVEFSLAASRGKGAGAALDRSPFLFE